MAIGMIAMAMIGVLSGCGTGSKGSGTAEQDKIVIGLDDNYPPVGFRDEQGNLIGSDIDLAKEAGKRLGVKVEFKPIDWSSKEAELNSKKIDAIWNGLTATPERAEKMLFTKPYQRSTQVIITKTGSSIQNRKDLAGKVVALQDGSKAADVLDKEPTWRDSFGAVKKYPDIVSALMDLKVGRVDAVLADEVVARYYMKEKKDGLQVLADRFGEASTIVGVQKDNQALKEKLDKVLSDMEKDGTMKQIFMKWYGEDLSYKGQ